MPNTKVGTTITGLHFGDLRAELERHLEGMDKLAADKILNPAVREATSFARTVVKAGTPVWKTGSVKRSIVGVVRFYGHRGRPRKGVRRSRKAVGFVGPNYNAALHLSNATERISRKTGRKDGRAGNLLEHGTTERFSDIPIPGTFAGTSTLPSGRVVNISEYSRVPRGRMAPRPWWNRAFGNVARSGIDRVFYNRVRTEHTKMFRKLAAKGSVKV